MGAPVAAIIIRKEKDLVAHFRSSGAVSAATARTQGELGVDDRLAWRRLTQRAVVREAGPGRFYLDEPSWEALRSTRHRMVFVMVVMLALAGFAWFMSSQV